jgi:hypothetical protein
MIGLMRFNMKPDDFIIATGGVSAPLWLPALNMWVTLALGVLSIVYVSWKLWRLYWNK